MPEEPTNEERLNALESGLTAALEAVAELRRDIETEKLAQVRVNTQQSDVSSALLATNDDIMLVHLKRLEKSQLDGFSKVLAELHIQGMRQAQLTTGQRNIEVRMDALDANVSAIPEILASHKAGIEHVEAQLAQVLALLTGQQKTND